ncbi:ribosome biogenesis protein SLX9-domain-containing protein [Suillus fuscotomentosus]|uniref:Ribosome biogenesis protein SLX9 n=1 Tax=Suillus fuscotomentosus TaxID=1912939 RepID=A0AAD4E3Y0_9AGAM|nr:ribosome biogenesis protein SLX9-domain-containing protein [Suillus fuscotomentosus]KAG1899105.1 ribosome biogenesis protein SLX9-domain-containing protein [Suillus fuscotomentosus]
MPRERRKRISAHEPSAKPAQRQFAVQENAVEAVEVGAAAEISGEVILQEMSTAATQPRQSIKKKEKQQLKHEAFIEKLKSKTSPYSKVQRRRFNRRQREQVGGGLDAIGAVLSAIDMSDSPEQGSPAAEETKDARAHKVQTKTLQIGEGKGIPLKKNQRKRALELEKLRQPLILSNPQYSSNLFQTIRTHAQNTLVKRVDVPEAQ